MNLPAARHALAQAITFRDVARWMTQRGKPAAARCVRHSMRLEAKRYVGLLRPDIRPTHCEIADTILPCADEPVPARLHRKTRHAANPSPAQV